MDTVTAASKARVTVATIRNWCANGVITATKVNGRWDVDADSLRARTRIARMIRKARAQRRLTEIRARVRAGLTLPALNGSDKQIDWAQELRTAVIERALDRLSVQRDGTVVYQLCEAGPFGADPLRIGDETGEVSNIRFGAYDTEADYLADFNRVLDAPLHRSAAWWINSYKPRYR